MREAELSGTAALRTLSASQWISTRSSLSISNATRVSAPAASVATPRLIHRRAPSSRSRGVRPQTGVQTRAAERLRLLPVEDAVDEILAQVELAPEAADQRDLGLDVGRLVGGPGHPGQQVLDAGVDGGLEQRRVGRLPAADHQPWSDDAIGGAGDQISFRDVQRVSALTFQSAADS